MENIAHDIVHPEKALAYFPIHKDMHQVAQSVVQQEQQEYQQQSHCGKRDNGIKTIIYYLDIFKNPKTPGNGFGGRHHKWAHKKDAVKKQVQGAKTNSQKKYLPFYEPCVVLFPAPVKQVHRVKKINENPGLIYTVQY
jgi:hypothetical protein